MAQVGKLGEAPHERPRAPFSIQLHIFTCSSGITPVFARSANRPRYSYAVVWWSDMEPLDAGSSPEISAGPPAKRMRTDPPEGISRIHPLPPPPMPVQSLQKGAHTRAVTACQTCRNRKTKCDNQRPTCGYCAKTGGSCSYLEDSIQITS